MSIDTKLAQYIVFSSCILLIFCLPQDVAYWRIDVKLNPCITWSNIKLRMYSIVKFDNVVSGSVSQDISFLTKNLKFVKQLTRIPDLSRENISFTIEFAPFVADWKSVRQVTLTLIHMDMTFSYSMRNNQFQNWHNISGKMNSPVLRIKDFITTKNACLLDNVSISAKIYHIIKFRKGMILVFKIIHFRRYI